jgi:hypothetical protein
MEDKKEEKNKIKKKLSQEPMGGDKPAKSDPGYEEGGLDRSMRIIGKNLGKLWKKLRA